MVRFMPFERSSVRRASRVSIEGSWWTPYKSSPAAPTYWRSRKCAMSAPRRSTYATTHWRAWSPAAWARWSARRSTHRSTWSHSTWCYWTNRNPRSIRTPRTDQPPPSSNIVMKAKSPKWNRCRSIRVRWPGSRSIWPSFGNCTRPMDRRASTGAISHRSCNIFQGSVFFCLTLINRRLSSLIFCGPLSVQCCFGSSTQLTLNWWLISTSPPKSCQKRNSRSSQSIC